MRPGVGADRVAAPGYFAHHGRIGERHAPDQEERGACAFGFQRVEHGTRIGAQRAVVEGQHDLLVGQETDVGILLVAEAGAGHGIDLDHPRNAQRMLGGDAFLRCRSQARAGDEQGQSQRRARYQRVH